MQKYLTLDEAAVYLGVSPETVKRYVEKGELHTYTLERAVRFRFEDLDALVSRNLEVLLTKGLRAVVTHAHQAAQGVDVWRIIVSFYDTTGKERLVIPFGPENKFTEYYVWVTYEYLEDFAHLPGSEQGAEKFALRYIQNRFEETKDEKGIREITRISENKVYCNAGQCMKGQEWTASTL